MIIQQATYSTKTPISYSADSLRELVLRFTGAGSGAESCKKIEANSSELLNLDGRKRLVIDVRSEREFARGSIPGAVNVPILNDSERSQVGICYKRAGVETSMRLGRELFQIRSVRFVDTVCKFLSPMNSFDVPCADHQVRSFGISGEIPEIIVFCWRGGLRSRSVGFLLTELGFAVQVVRGGYKAFREVVRSNLEEFASKSLIVLHGRTGVGKSQFLGQLGSAGVPVVDFEKAANHRGSAFGDMGLGLPSTQQMFENRIYCQYSPIRAARRVAVEVEDRIGPVRLPKGIGGKMRRSPVIVLARDFQERVDLIHRDYCRGLDGLNSPDRHDIIERLSLLKGHLSADVLQSLKAAVEKGHIKYIIRSLLTLRYDPLYDKSIRRMRFNIVNRYSLSKDAGVAVAQVKEYCI